MVCPILGREPAADNFEQVPKNCFCPPAGSQQHSQIENCIPRGVKAMIVMTPGLIESMASGVLGISFVRRWVFILGRRSPKSELSTSSRLLHKVNKYRGRIRQLPVFHVHKNHVAFDFFIQGDG
jgi:hypothetical protein